MTNGFKLAFKIVALLCLGIAGFHQLTAWSAPGHGQAAALTGLLLTTFGVVAAQFAMQLVVLPLAVLRMLQRIFQGRKPMVITADGRDPLDIVARVVFVVGFTMLSAVVGACTGLVAGGHGVVASAGAFAAFGALLAILVPADVVFASDEDTGGTTTDEQRADHAAAREAGEPTVLFADRVVKDLRETFVEDERKP